VAALWLLLDYRWLRGRVGRVRADERGLRLDGKLVVFRSSIRSAHVYARGSARGVRLVRRWSDIEVVIESEPDAHALVAALKIGPPYGSLTFTVGPSPAGFVGLILALVAASLFILWPVLSGLPVNGWSTVFMGGISVVLSLVLGRSVTVGADGLLVRTLLSRRFVPFSAIQRVEVKDGVVVSLAKGERLRFAPRNGESRELVRHIEDALARFRERGTSDANVATLLARSGRAPREWIRTLRAAPEKNAGFRSAAVPDGEHWRILENPASPRAARAGAAVALASEIDEAGRSRLRVAAKTCADPKLRVALDAASRPDADEALEAALDDLDDERARLLP
jgi:hypothetical protein